jgi:hypothetical protein
VSSLCLPSKVRSMSFFPGKLASLSFPSNNAKMLALGIFFGLYQRNPKVTISTNLQTLRLASFSLERALSSNSHPMSLWWLLGNMLKDQILINERKINLKMVVGEKVERILGQWSQILNSRMPLTLSHI